MEKGEIEKLIKTTAVEMSALIVEKLGSGLSAEIMEKIKPLQKSEIDYLKEEIEHLKNDVYYFNKVVDAIENRNVYCLNVVKKAKVAIQNKLMEDISVEQSKQK